MAATRYGTIVHSYEKHVDRRCDLRFENAAARQAFKEKFDAYHASHDHDGPAPVFKNTTSAELQSNDSWNIPLIDAVTIDGYHAYQILEYHQAVENSHRFVAYHPPTCCIPPLVALDRGKDNLVGADTFERHELSAIFGDIRDEEFERFKERLSVDGVVENIIKVYEGQILDGWHRYRACKELNLLRKLRFQVWDPDTDGDPEVFVLARNLDRRHYSASRRAQIAVHFNERFGHGGDRASRKERNLKTQQELADAYGVGKRTISDAATVEKLGKSEAVIQGKTTTAQVIETAKKGKRA